MHEFTIPPDPHEQADLHEDADQVTAWEEIDTGRYMPRRIRGSYRGGQLG